jgi:hypothetical protein
MPVVNKLLTLGKLIFAHREPVSGWESAEKCVASAIRHEGFDTVICNKGLHPDFILDDIGLEVKSTKADYNKRINLNASAPTLDEIYYLIVHLGYKNDEAHKEEISDLAIVHNANYYDPVIQEMAKSTYLLGTNPNLRIRQRIVYEIENPFKIWGRGFYLIDVEGNKTEIQ